MKKILLLTALLGIMWGAVAQKTDYAVLKIVLHPVQSIILNPAQKYVNLEYKNADDYTVGVTSFKENHLKVFSTGAFNILAEKSTGINDGVVTVTPQRGYAKPLDGTQMEVVSLTNRPQNLISSGSSAYNHTYNITYKGVGNGSFLDFLNKGRETTHRTLVTYTITPK